MIEDDEEQMKEELKEAFRIYDKDSQGFITTTTLKEILREVDTTLIEVILITLLRKWMKMVLELWILMNFKK